MGHHRGTSGILCKSTTAVGSPGHPRPPSDGAIRWTPSQQSTGPWNHDRSMERYNRQLFRGSAFRHPTPCIHQNVHGDGGLNRCSRWSRGEQDRRGGKSLTGTGVSGHRFNALATLCLSECRESDSTLRDLGPPLPLSLC